MEAAGAWAVPTVRVAAVWAAGYGIFLIHALMDGDGFLVLDHVNLLFHEGGHFIFGFLGLIGGTVGELAFPVATLVVFLRRRELAGATFGAFWIGEDLRYIGRYVSDARARALPLVGTGDHDWHLMLSDWGLLHRDRLLGGTLATLGWLVMLGAVGTLIALSVARARGRAGAAD